MATLQMSGAPVRGMHVSVNGWVLSVQWGAGNYCGNYAHSVIEEMRGPAPQYLKDPQHDAEIALWQDGGEMIQLGCDTVMGRVPMRAVYLIIGYLAQKPRAEKDVRKYVKKVGTV